LAEWSDYYRASGASLRTIDGRIRTMRSLMNHAGAVDPLAVTSRQVIAWLAAQTNPGTRATYRAGAKQFFLWAHRYGLLEADPMVLVPSVRPPAPQPRPLNVETVLLAISSARTGRARSYLILGFYAGLRVHEIAKVHSDDVSVDGRSLFVRGKGGVAAVLPMHPLVVALARYRSDGWWFPSSRDRSGHVSANSVSRTIKSGLVAAGAPVGSHAHQLRHTFITSLFGVTSNARVVQELARHASLQTTQGYAGVEQSAMRIAIGKLAA
jgi:site-specific recombinase XerD